MNVPGRILDGGSGNWERKILESATRDAPTPEFRARVAKELVVLASVATLTSATTATAQTLSVVAWLKLLGAGAVMGLATAGISYAIGTTPRHTVHDVAAPAERTAAPAAIAPPRTIEAMDAAKTDVPPAPSAPAASLRAPSREEAEPERPVAAANSALPSRASMAPPDTALSEELRAIEKVRRALAAGDATAALGVLDRYEVAGGTKLLAVEAKVLRIEALARQGNDAGARSLARRFYTEHPDSPYLQRVRSLVGDEP
jgi:hypothetical protein